MVTIERAPKRTAPRRAPPPLETFGKRGRVSSKTKRRAIVVAGIVVIVAIVVAAIVAGGTSARTVTVAEAVEGGATGERIQVTGNVVPDSYYNEDNDLVFSMYDPENEGGATLQARYEGGVSATFGNDVTAICTGKIGDDGVLVVSELVTKCPSKYENSEDALPVSQLIGYGEEIVGTTVKVTGAVEEGSLASAMEDVRFAVLDTEDGTQLLVRYDGALPDGMAEGSIVVLTGALSADGSFAATNVALEG